MFVARLAHKRSYWHHYQELHGSMIQPQGHVVGRDGQSHSDINLYHWKEDHFAHGDQNSYQY